LLGIQRKKWIWRIHELMEQISKDEFSAPTLGVLGALAVRF
jgi:hypothetical protein